MRLKRLNSIDQPNAKEASEGAVPGKRQALWAGRAEGGTPREGNLILIVCKRAISLKWLQQLLNWERDTLL